MAAAPARHGIILLAHGSRDPLWRKPVESVAERVLQLDPAALVQCAYLELTQPDLPACAERMVQAGIQSVSIVPMFLGVGKHAREDLPRVVDALIARHPGVRFKLQPAIGEDERVVDLLANIALTRS
jgi:sirohydrochlorin cobaltochelatase